MDTLFDINRYRQQLDQAMANLNGPETPPSGRGPDIPVSTSDQDKEPGSTEAPQNLSASTTEDQPDPQQAPQSQAPPSDNVVAGPSAVPGQPAQPGSNLSAGGPPKPSGPGAQPHGAMMGSDEQGQQPSQIPSGPPDMQFMPDSDKLKNAKHVGDVIDSLPKKQVDKYMDWWEKEHGSIEAKFDQMNASLGVRPDKDAAPTRKDMFRMLMDFGLNLIRNSSPQNSAGRGVNIASAVGQAAGNQSDYQAQQQQIHDTKAQAIEGERQAALKNLGTRGQAMEGAGRISAEDARVQAEQSRQAMYEGKYDTNNVANPNNPIVDQSGNLHFTSKTGKDIPLMDAQGKPVKANLSAMKGRGASNGRPSVYQQKMDAYDKLNPLPDGASQADVEKHNLDALRYAAGGHSEMSSDKLVKAQRMAVQYLGTTDGSPEYADQLKQKTGEMLESLQAADEPKPKGNLSAPKTTTAPQSALDALKKNPAMKAQFQAKYGYLPPGY